MLKGILAVLTVLWFAFMTFLSHQTGDETAVVSRNLATSICALFGKDTNGEIMNAINGKLRRAAHVVVLAVFSFLFGMCIWVYGLSLWWMTAVIIWDYVDEATKPFIQGRHFSWGDVALNLLGTLVIIGCFAVVRIYCS